MKHVVDWVFIGRSNWYGRSDLIYYPFVQDILEKRFNKKDLAKLPKSHRELVDMQWPGVKLMNPPYVIWR